MRGKSVLGYYHSTGALEGLLRGCLSVSGGQRPAYQHSPAALLSSVWGSEKARCFDKKCTKQSTMRTRDETNVHLFYQFITQGCCCFHKAPQIHNSVFFSFPLSVRKQMQIEVFNKPKNSLWFVGTRYFIQLIWAVLKFLPSAPKVVSRECVAVWI